MGFAWLLVKLIYIQIIQQCLHRIFLVQSILVLSITRLRVTRYADGSHPFFRAIRTGEPPYCLCQGTCGIFTTCHIERMWSHGNRERNSLMFLERRQPAAYCVISQGVTEYVFRIVSAYMVQELEASDVSGLSGLTSEALHGQYELLELT